MKRRTADALELGPEVVQLLLPHRPPLQLVDRVMRFCREPAPALVARRHITVNEPVFAGHFPDLKIWPGIYTIEGLGQSCNLLSVIKGMLERWESNDGDPEQVLGALKNLELGYRMHPGFKPDQADFLRQEMPDPRQLLGLSTSVEVKLLAPVFAGSCLEYSVRELDQIDQIVRWEVEASVEARPVARGVMCARIGAALQAPAGSGG
jgi:3-hydroxyacyl-[acyl-carrier-protein] dehydratase